MNKITKEQYPDIWDNLIEDCIDMEKEHRRGSTFYVSLRFKIDEDNAPDNPEIHGDWESETTTWTDDWGPDGDVEELFRVEKKEKIKFVWERVK